MKLYKGDCLKVMKTIQDKSIDAIITDLPYGTTACKWDSVIPFDLMWEQLNRIIKPNAAIVLFGSQPFTSALIMSNVKNYRTSYVWDKQKSVNFVQAKNHPMKRTEDILVFGLNRVVYNPQMVKRDLKEVNKQISKMVKNESKYKCKDDSYLKVSGGYKRNTNKDYAYPTNIITISSISKECNPKHRQHPTQKPVKLMEYLIKTYTNEKETVLDFTMGSGSTGVACKNTNRNFIGIEQDENYFNIAQKRIKETEYKLF